MNGQPAKLVIDNRRQTLDGMLIAVFPVMQQQGNVRRIHGIHQETECSSLLKTTEGRHRAAPWLRKAVTAYSGLRFCFSVEPAIKHEL